ncbi:MAG: thioesterase domain-containing protein, partial [Blastocatellia bacterium]
EIIRMEGWEEPESSIVAIQPKGTKPPFFCIHAKGGNVLFYKDLAKHLGEDQPFYGIQARRVGGRQVGHATVEEMAEFYIREMKEIQPEGPYYLGGSSFGGYAAFEMARQLTAKGHKIGMLAMFDTSTPEYKKLMPGTSTFQVHFHELLGRLKLHQDSLTELSGKEKAKYLLQKLNKVRIKYRRTIANKYKKYVRRFYANVKGTSEIPKKYIQIEDQIYRASKKFNPGKFSGDMTIFRAETQPFGVYPDRALGWGPLVEGSIEILDIPGHHTSIMAEPYVKVLAEKLMDQLELIHQSTKKTPKKKNLNGKLNHEANPLIGLSKG